MQMKKITNIKLSYQCDQKWDKMTACGQDRFCELCNKSIIDFRNLNQSDLEREIIKSNGDVCGLLTKSQTTTPSFLSRISYRLLIALGFSSLFNSLDAQTVDSINYIKNCNDTTEELVLGMFETFPVYKNGGSEGLNDFIRANLKYPDSLQKNGRVVVQFTVDTIGRVKDIVILKSLEIEADKEVIRVVSLLEFIPGRHINKAIEGKMTLPISFSRKKSEKSKMHYR